MHAYALLVLGFTVRHRRAGFTVRHRRAGFTVRHRRAGFIVRHRRVIRVCIEAGCGLRCSTAQCTAALDITPCHLCIRCMHCRKERHKRLRAARIARAVTSLGEDDNDDLRASVTSMMSAGAQLQSIYSRLFTLKPEVGAALVLQYRAATRLLCDRLRPASVVIGGSSRVLLLTHRTPLHAGGGAGGGCAAA